MIKQAEGTGTGRRNPGPGFTTRLLVAQGLVLVAGALTSWVVASAVGPAIFRDHLERADVAHTSAEAAHVEEAFTAALIIALLVALLTSVVMALAVTWYFTQRVQRSVTAMADSAAGIATGQFSSRVPSPGLGGGVDQLVDTVNQLALRLDETEITRRRMLSDLAHEMRTPLATLDAHLEALEDGVRNLDEPTLLVLRSSTHRLGRLAQDISAVSRAEEGNLEIRLVPTDPRDLVEAAIREAQDRYRAKDVSLVADAASSAMVSADPERMVQVLGNLLDNALRHTPRGGTVTLTHRNVDDRWVDLVVQDSGEGIEPEHLAHVFDRFYRADAARNSQHGGSGIGLAIAKALVEAHGGGISANSTGRGRGSTFTVRLPATRE
ncbi:MAG: sensor histidine kinase [Aeromicrobium sp.]